MALAVLGCLLASLILTGLARRHALVQGMIDQPGLRRSHESPTPRGGGIGPVVALLASLVLVWSLDWIDTSLTAALAVALITMGLLGWLDDRQGLSVRIRLMGQVTAAGLILWLVDGLQAFDLGVFQVGSGWMTQLGALISLVWLTNLFNFMDGIDGLATGQAVFVAAALAVLAGLAGEPGIQLCAALLAAAAAGFLPWNFPRARVFLGDSGSAALGLCLGVLVIEASNTRSVSPQLSGLLLSLFIVDATATLIWRFLKGDQWYTAHREHAYQRLARIGQSHVRVTLGAMSINILFIIPLLWWARPDPGLELAATFIAASVLLIGWFMTRTVNEDRRVD